MADYFYRGPLAKELDAWSQANGGLIRYEDLAAHTTPIEEPVSIDYRGHTIAKCGPWTQGPFLLQTLRLLEKSDLKAMGHNRPDYVHVLTEAMKLALADRDTYYADPRFVKVPLTELLSPEYAELRRGLIDRQHASLELRPGDPLAGKALLGKSPAGVSHAGRADPRHDDLPGGRPLGQRRGGHAQRLGGRIGRRNRRDPRQPAAEPQHLARPSELHRPGQAAP